MDDVKKALREAFEWFADNPWTGLVALFIVGALLFSLGTCAG